MCSNFNNNNNNNKVILREYSVFLTLKKKVLISYPGIAAMLTLLTLVIQSSNLIHHIL